MVNSNKKLEKILNNIRNSILKKASIKDINLVDMKKYLMKIYGRVKIISNQFTFRDFVSQIINVKHLREDLRRFLHNEPYNVVPPFHHPERTVLYLIDQS